MQFIIMFIGRGKLNGYLSANTDVCQGNIWLSPEILLDCSYERDVWPSSSGISKSIFC
jgi:hypothetical protein